MLYSSDPNQQQQQQYQQPAASAPPVVYVQALPTATPVNPNVAVYSSVPTTAQPPINPVYAVPIQQQQSPILVQETPDVGICRRCRQPFRRPPGVNDGHASYYRCERCNDYRAGELLDSCVIA